MIDYIDALPDGWRQVVLIGLFFVSAWLIQAVVNPVLTRVIRINRIGGEGRSIGLERRETLRGLLTSLIQVLVFVLAFVSSLSLFVEADTLLFVVGLFTAGFGIGANLFIRDFLAGISLIFENTFEVGEKVEFRGLGGGDVEGVIEATNVRTTYLRSPTGELFVIPNGDIRVVRNFSRGKFSPATISLVIPSAELPTAIPLLEALGKEAVSLLPNLLDVWKVVSTSDTLGRNTELTLVARAKFGTAGEMQPRMLALIQERLAEAGIELGG